MTSCSVYYLLDPRVGRPNPQAGDAVYVGVANDPTVRWRAHCYDALNRRAITPKANWIRSLYAGAASPLLTIRCVVEGKAEAKRIEMALIARLRENGCRIKNATAGGDGMDAPTPELRAKLSAAHLWHIVTEATRAKIGAANRG